MAVSEQEQLGASRNKMVHDIEIGVREENTTKYASHFETIMKYLDDRELDQALLTLSQCRVTLASLKVFKEEGIQIPDVVLEKLAQDEAEFLDEAKALDVDDLERSVLCVTPSYSVRARDMPAEISAGVDQHGINERRVSLEDAADLKEQPGDEA